MPSDFGGDVRSPLTYGQLSVVRALQQLPSDRWHETYLSSSVSLLPGTDLAAVMSALATVQARHESLRTHFVGEDPGETQAEAIAVTLASATPAVDVIEAAGMSGDEAVAVARRQVGRRFAWADETAWRAAVVTVRGRPARLVVTVDHIVADAGGLRRLMAELRALLRGDDPIGARHLAEAAPQPRVLAAAQRSAAWQPRRDATARYWDGLLRDLDPDVFPWPLNPGDAGRVEGVLRATRARSALSQVAHRFCISPQSVMLALAAVAAASVYGRDEVVLTLQASNRYDRRWRHIVSSMNQATPLPAFLRNRDESFESFAQQLHWRGINAYRHASYHFDDIVNKVRAVRGVDLEFDVYFNFLANSVEAADHPAKVRHEKLSIEETHPLRQVGPRFDIKIRDGADMPVLLRTDPTILPQPQLNELLRWVFDELCLLAGGAAARLGDVRSRCDRWRLTVPDGGVRNVSRV